MPQVTPPTPDCAESAQGGFFKRFVARVRCFEKDVDAVIQYDPAVRSPAEVVLTYPGLHALWLHRAANSLWKKEKVLPSRLVAHFNRFLTGIEIHPAAEMGQGVFIDHGMGVVIGETAKIGDGCIIYKGVVLGGTTLSRGQRHPKLGKNVVVGTNAVVLGDIEVGDGARIGSGSVVIRDVSEKSTVVGVPGREMPARGDRSARFESTLDHAALPDPTAEIFRELRRQEEMLRARIAALENRLGFDSSSWQDEEDERALATSDLPELDEGLNNPPPYGG